MTVLPFIKGDFDPGVLLAMTDEGCLFDSQRLAIFDDPFFEQIEQSLIRQCAHLHVISLIEMGDGVRDAVCPSVVVGEQE